MRHLLSIEDLDRADIALLAVWILLAFNYALRLLQRTAPAQPADEARSDRAEQDGAGPPVFVACPGRLTLPVSGSPQFDQRRHQADTDQDH